MSDHQSNADLESEISESKESKEMLLLNGRNFDAIFINWIDSGRE